MKPQLQAEEVFDMLLLLLSVLGGVPAEGGVPASRGIPVFQCAV
jgi:hypothetical protein